MLGRRTPYQTRQHGKACASRDSNLISGPAKHDFGLQAVELYSSFWHTSAMPVISLHEAGYVTSGTKTILAPGDLIVTLVTPRRAGDAARYKFTVASGEHVVLKPETTYAVVLANSQGSYVIGDDDVGEFHLRKTDLDRVDQRMLGWTLPPNGSWKVGDEWLDRPIVPKMNIYGLPLGERGVVLPQRGVDVAEGGTATYEVSLAAPPAGDVVVTINPTGNSDVTVAPASLTFTSFNWDTVQDVTVSAGSDSGTDDETATITHTVTSATGFNGVSVDDVSVAVLDDDNTDTRVSFAQSAYYVTEGGSVDVTLTLPGALSSDVTIPISKTDQGGATGYSGVPASVTIKDGDTAGSFTFTVTSNTANDDGQSVALTLGMLPSIVVSGIRPSTTVYFVDDDVPQVTVSFDESEYLVTEGEITTVTVELSADPERTVVIPINLEKLGDTKGAEHSGAPSRMMFYSGETSKTFDVDAVDDDVDETDEGFTLSFTDLPDGVSAGTND